MHQLPTCSAGKGCFIVNYKAPCFPLGKSATEQMFLALISSHLPPLALATGIWQQYADTSISRKEIPHVIKGKEHSISGSSGYQCFCRGICERQTSNRIKPTPALLIRMLSTLLFGELLFILPVGKSVNQEILNWFVNK